MLDKLLLILRDIIVSILCVVAAHSLIVFVYYDLKYINPGEWDIVVRVAYGVLIIVLLGGIIDELLKVLKRSKRR